MTRPGPLGSLPVTLHTNRADHPFHVALETDLWGSWHRAVTEAAQLINDKAEKRLFYLPQTPIPEMAMVMHREPPGPNRRYIRSFVYFAPGISDLTLESDIWYEQNGEILNNLCRIPIHVQNSALVDFRVRVNAIIHELMHTLGFDHDSVVQSVMNPHTGADRRILESDVGRLKRI